MKAQLNDIRLLKLAEMYEAAYEQFILEMATRYIEDPALRERLLQAASPEDRHAERIAAELERLNAAVGPQDRADIARAALLDVRDVERAARDFYLRHADEVHDRGVARLFRDLAREEDRHLQLAEELVRAVEHRSALRGARPGTVDPLRLLRAADAMMLPEGVGDLGRQGPSRRQPP